MTVFAKSRKTIKNFITELKRHFEITSKDVDLYLGILLVVNKDENIFIHEEQFVEEILNSTCPTQKA